MPPLIVGDAFPIDAIPVPAIFDALPQEEIHIPKTLPWEDWVSLCETGKFPKSKNGKIRRVERMHVVMDRAKGTSVDGGLRSEQGFQPEKLVFIALVDDALGLNGLKTLVEKLSAEGWGQGRTYGYGHVTLDSIEKISPPSEGDYFVSLGHLHPTDDLPKGYWRWEGVPVRPHDFETRHGPTQYFTTMLMPGATFEQNEKEWLGRCIGLNTIQDYLHFGISPIWRVKFTMR